MSGLASRRLGNSGIELTTVGFGAWAAGGPGWAFAWGDQEDADSVAAITHAVSRGVGWIDTAAVYGLGHSEEVVAAALRTLPAGRRPRVFTKCGRRPAGDDPARLVTDLRPARLRAECEASLTRLGVEVIDLEQIHWPDDATGVPLEESWGELARLQDEGKVRLLGASNFDLDQLRRCEAIRHVDSLQPPLSLVHPEALAELIPWCSGNGTGVLVYSPMRSGLLTERMSAARVAALGAGDWRARHPDFQGERLRRNLALRDRLLPIARRYGVGAGAVAVAWTLAQPGVTAAIVGARTPAQVDGWVEAAGLVLEPEDLAGLNSAARI